MNFEEIEKKVIEWGKERGILNLPTPKPQLIKLEEELDELEDSIRRSSMSEIIDAIGDMTVVLTMISAIIGVNMTHCYNEAYNEIKDRKGKTVNGIFIKEI